MVVTEVLHGNYVATVRSSPDALNQLKFSTAAVSVFLPSVIQVRHTGACRGLPSSERRRQGGRPGCGTQAAEVEGKPAVEDDGQVARRRRQ